MKKQRSSQKGFSLVEALVAIAVLLITLVGPMTIAAQGIKSSQFALEQNTSFFLAQEGIEAIFSIRNDYALQDVDDGLDTAGGDPDTSWNWIGVLNAGPCSISANGDSCSFGTDFRNFDPGGNLTSSECTSNTDPDCRLNIDASASAAPYKYTHAPGDVSPFYRVITVTLESVDSVKVESSVTWKSHAFGGDDRTVTLTTYLFDIPYEF